MDPQKRFSETAKRDREMHKKATERNLEQQRRANEQFQKFQRDAASHGRSHQTGENGYSKNGTSISDVLGYIFIFIVLCFIIYIGLMVLSGF
jgi:Flp pilus assembly protein TadB